MTTLQSLKSEYAAAIENSYYPTMEDMLSDAIDYLNKNYGDEELYDNFSDSDVEDVIFNDSDTYRQIDRDGIEYALDILKARTMYDDFIENEYENYPEECIDALNDNGVNYNLDGTTINGNKVEIAECLIKNVEFGAYCCEDESLRDIIYNYVYEYIEQNAKRFQDADAESYAYY